MIKTDFSYFSTKTCVLGTQTNRPNETVRLSTQNTHMFKFMSKNYDTFSLFFFFFFFFCLPEPMSMIINQVTVLSRKLRPRGLLREGCNDITCIDLRLLGENNENISRNGSAVVECLTRDRGAMGSTSGASLRCVLEQDTFILAFWFNPGKPVPI